MIDAEIKDATQSVEGTDTYAGYPSDIREQIMKGEEIEKGLSKSLDNDSNEDLSIATATAIVEGADTVIANEPLAVSEPLAEPTDDIVSLKQELQKLQSQHNVLQGKYKAELPAALAEKKRLMESLDAEKAKYTVFLEQQLASKQIAPEAIQQVDTDLAQAYEDYPELKLFDAKYARETADLRATIADLRATIVAAPVHGELKSQVDTLTRAHADNVFYAALTSLVPNWKEINATQEFIERLSLPVDEDPEGRNLDEILGAAKGKGNAKAVAALFNKYHKVPVMAVQNPPIKKQIGLPPTNNGQVHIEATGHTIKLSEIRNFNSRVASGYYDSKPTAFKEMSDKIDKATRLNSIDHDS
jgi:hypothetical protein